jgi:hypothetical protein
MNEEIKELLTIFMEECAEATVEASKLIRFGSETFGDVHKLEVEVGDLLYMIELLQEYGLINNLELEMHKRNKREKLKKWSNLKRLS